MPIASALTAPLPALAASDHTAGAGSPIAVAPTLNVRHGDVGACGMLAPSCEVAFAAAAAGAFGIGATDTAADDAVGGRGSSWACRCGSAAATTATLAGICCLVNAAADHSSPIGRPPPPPRVAAALCTCPPLATRGDAADEVVDAALRLLAGWADDGAVATGAPTRPTKAPPRPPPPRATADPPRDPREPDPVMATDASLE